MAENSHNIFYDTLVFAVGRRILFPYTWIIQFDFRYHCKYSDFAIVDCFIGYGNVYFYLRIYVVSYCDGNIIGK